MKKSGKMADDITSSDSEQETTTTTNNTAFESLILYLQENMLVSVIEQAVSEKCVIKVVP